MGAPWGMHLTRLAETSTMETTPPGVLDFLLNAKHLAIIVLMLLGLALLLFRRVNLWVRIGGMVLAFVLYGLDWVFPLHPSPMCATTKLFMFKFTFGKFFPAFVALFLVMMIPSLFGRKLFCGWVCPLGAVQELVNKIPFKWRWKNINFPVFNGIRFSLIALFLLTFFAATRHIGDLAEATGADVAQGPWLAYSNFNIYDNFFELLHWSTSTTFFVMFAILIAISLVLYRPFCYAVCPVGALTWLLERVAPGRIRVDQTKCNNCGICAVKSPCPTIRPLFEGKTRMLPDCTSCGECLDTCPKDAIAFRFHA